MKKVIVAALSLLMCFSLCASAADIFTVEPTAINTVAGENDTVIYTSQYGETVTFGDVSNFYVITVVPRYETNDESSEEMSSSEILESSDVSDISNEISNEIVSEETVSSEGVLPEILPSTDDTSDSENVFTTRNSQFKYKVLQVYAPQSGERVISIPENGFAVAFPASEVSDPSSDESQTTRNVTAADIEAGAPVAVYGVDFDALTVSEDAYIQIDLSQKGLLGDIPQTADKSALPLLAIISVVSLAGVALIRRKAL